MSTSSIVSNRRVPWWRRILQIEQVLIFAGLVIYAILASLNQKAPLLILMGSIMTVGNLLIPIAFLARRIYANRPFPWN